MTDRQPHAWERQPKETPPAFEAFRLYLELGPARSTAKVARQLGKSKTLMDRWSSRDRWVARAAAWEAHQAEHADATWLDEIQQRTKRHAEIAALHGEALVLPARELMRRLQTDPKLLERLDTDTLIRLEATSARAYNRVVVTERLARGMSTENIGGHDGGPLTSAQERARQLNDDELDDLLLGAGLDGYRQGLEDAGK